MGGLAKVESPDEWTLKAKNLPKELNRRGVFYRQLAERLQGDGSPRASRGSRPSASAPASSCEVVTTAP